MKSIYLTDIPEDVFRVLKATAVLKGQNFKDYLKEILYQATTKSSIQPLSSDENEKKD